MKNRPNFPKGYNKSKSKEELKSEIIALLEDIFKDTAYSYGSNNKFNYTEQGNIFKCDYEDGDCYAEISVDKEGIDFEEGVKDGYDEGGCGICHIKFKDVIKLNKLLQQFYGGV